MARLFDDAGSEYLEKDAAPFTAEPFSMACWFRPDDAANNGTLMWVGDKDVNNNAHILQARGGQTGDPVRAYSRDSALVSFAETSTGYSVNTWHHAAGVWTSSTSRAAFIDGGSKGTNTQGRSVSGEDRTSIGRSGDSTPGNHMSGRICECAIWSVALTDLEVSYLALGVKPIYIRPASLLRYWPIWGLHSPEIDLSRNGDDLTLFGGTPALANHAPVTLFTPKWAASVPLIEVAAGGGFAHTQAVIIA